MILATKVCMLAMVVLLGTDSLGFTDVLPKLESVVKWLYQ